VVDVVVALLRELQVRTELPNKTEGKRKLGVRVGSFGERGNEGRD